MRRLFVLPAFILILALSACTEGAQSLKIQSATDKVYSFNVEIADTEVERARGLMWREKLSDNQGMLFVFPDEAVRGFWMKNVPISLDIIFIRKDGVIAHIHHNAVPDDVANIPSLVPVAAVLEIKGGLAKQYNIAVGNQVEHKFFERK